MTYDDNSLRDLNEKMIQNILSDPIFNVEKAILSNGLTVIFNKEAGRANAYMTIYVKAGSENDPRGKKGLAHLYEHLAYRDGGQNKFDREMSKVALYYSAGTSYCRTVYKTEILKEYLHKAVELEALRFGNIGSYITQQEINQEVEIIRNEYMNNQSLSGFFLSSIVRKTLFKRSDPLWTDVLGNYNDLSSVTPEDVMNFERNYAPNNTIILISGDFEANDIFTLVEKHFGKKENPGNIIAKESVRPYTREQKHFYYAQKIVENTLLICYEEPGKFSRDWIPTKAALFFLLKYNGKVDKVSYSTYSLLKKGYFYYPIMGEDKASVYQNYVQTIENINYESITDSVLLKIQNDLIKGSVFSSDRSNKLNSLAQMEVALGEPSNKQLIDQIRNITKEDIRYAIEKYINNDCHKTVTIVKSPDFNLVFPQAKEIKKDTSWFNPLTKKITSGESFREHNLSSGIDKIPVVNNNFPSPWRFRLSNGVRIFGSTIKDCGIIEGTVLIKLSRYSENKGLSGINLYCAKAMTGTRELPPDKYREKAELLSSEIVVKYFPFQLESLEIYFKTYKKNIKELFGLIEEALITPHITEESIEEIKSKLHIDIVKTKHDDVTSGKEFRLFLQLSFGKDHPFSREQQGYLSDKENISVTAVKEHCSDYIKPDITDICITGDITREFCREALASLENRWQGKHKRFPAKQKPDPAPKGRIYVLNTPDNDNVHISFFRLAPPEKSKEYYLVSFMNNLLGNSFQSCLYHNLRNRDGLAYEVGSGVFPFGTMSFFDACANTNIRSAANVFRIMNDTVFTYAEIFNEDMFKFSLDHAIKERNSYINDISTEVINLKKTAFHNMNYNRRKWQGNILSTITLSDVKEVAGKFFDPSEFYFIVEGDAEKLMKPLSKLGYGNPVEILLDEERRIDYLLEWRLNS